MRSTILTLVLISGLLVGGCGRTAPESTSADESRTATEEPAVEASRAFVLEMEATGYKEVTRENLRLGTDFGELTSYAGRRNDDASSEDDDSESDDASSD